MANVQIQTGSDNTVKAYEFLKANAGNAFTIAEVAAELGLTSAQVTGGLVSLAKKEVVIRAEKTGKDKIAIENVVRMIKKIRNQSQTTEKELITFNELLEKINL